MNIGEKIKQARKEKGLTQDELAQKIGISKNGLWNYENNKRYPNIEILTKIVDVLDIDLWDIVENKNEVKVTIPPEVVYKVENKIKQTEIKIEKNKNIVEWLENTDINVIIQKLIERNKGLENLRKSFDELAILHCNDLINPSFEDRSENSHIYFKAFIKKIVDIINCEAGNNAELIKERLYELDKTQELTTFRDLYTYHPMRQLIEKYIDIE